jgi:hypothetical protein
MGAYFLVVNPTKRQYLDPGRFLDDEDVKYSGLLHGRFCIEALKLLVSDCFRRNESSFDGAWLGDPVILASDATGLPIPGIVTGTAEHPDRNLYYMAKAEFMNISYRALAELASQNFGATAREFAEMAKVSQSFLANLSATVEQYHLPLVEAMLEETLGSQWREAAQASKREWSTLPPIDWPL